MNLLSNVINVQKLSTAKRILSKKFTTMSSSSYQTIK